MAHLSRDCPTTTCSLSDSLTPVPESLADEEEEVEEDVEELPAGEQMNLAELPRDLIFVPLLQSPATCFDSPSPMPETLTDKEEEVEGVEKLPAGEQRNWAELPEDALSVIFKKIAAIEIIRSAQFVCRPELWRSIDITGHADLLNTIDMNTLAMEAVRRSSGCLEEFHGEYAGNNELIDFMAARATPLRCLRLIALEITAAHEIMNYESLVLALQKFPLLEELELTLFTFSDKEVELIGRACLI